MKKLLITSLCLALALTAAGCSGNDSKAINNLDAQLDRVNTVVSETSTTEVNSVSPVQLDYTQPSQIQAIRKNAYNNMMREEELRQDVLSTIGYIKSTLNNKYKLGKSKSTALNNLTKNLETHTINLSKTKSSVKQNVNNIKKYTRPQSSDADITRSSYNELDNLMQARAVYLENLQNTMNEICNILENSIVQENTIQNNTTTQPQTKTGTIKKNIDTYNNGLKENREIEENTEDQNLEQTSNMNNTYYNYPNAPYNNPYNNYYRDYRFNPNRNTDTFYPRGKNIDTYRFNPYYGTNPNWVPNPYSNNWYGNNQINNSIPASTNQDEKCEDCEENCEKQCLNDNLTFYTQNEKPINDFEQNCKDCEKCMVVEKDMPSPKIKN